MFKKNFFQKLSFGFCFGLLKIWPRSASLKVTNYSFNPLKFLETKNWLIVVWAACVKNFFIFFHFFLLDKWITYFTSFLWTPSTSNSDSVWARGKFLLKTGIKLIFLVLSEELLHAAMWLKLPKGWRIGY
jgi:hypothetical protein